MHSLNLDYTPRITKIFSHVMQEYDWVCAGVVAGVFVTAATGYILYFLKILFWLYGSYWQLLTVFGLLPIDSCFISGSWDDVFKVAVALYIIGTLVLNFFSTGEKILDWVSQNM